MENDFELDWNIRLSNVVHDEIRYREHWGDEYLWTSMLPLAWSSIDISGISIRARRRQRLGGDSHESAIAQWSMAIHLLGLGMGWTDIAKGLRGWREHDYREGHHPILDFLLNNFGDQIEALEVFFAISSRNEINDALLDIRRSARGDNSSLEIENQFGSEYEFQLREFLEEDRYGEKSFGRLLLESGDALHLDSHCASSFRDALRDMMGMEIRTRQGEYLKIWTPYYGGWAHRLAATTRDLHTDEFLEADCTMIDVDIKTIGYIGTFAWGGTTNRWFRYSQNYGHATQQFEAHCWGN